jgi:hypothetical protein
VTDAPLPTLLSQLLLAFTIEFDNQAEHRLPHRTTRGGASSPGCGPWLVSQAMWANFMQFVGADGVPLRVLRDPHGALPRYPMVLHRGGWPDGS